MTIPTVPVSQSEWNAAREARLVKEKELTRARDVPAAERRRLPMVPVEKEYRFEGPAGEVSLLDLFEGHRQLIGHRFYLDPDMQIADYPENGCPGCTMFADNLSNQLIHLNARDTTMVFVSAGSQEATTADDFSDDLDVGQYFGINVFFRDGDQMYRSYFTTARAAEELSSVWALLDMTPFGHQEEFQDAPDGVPQDRTGSWVRLHDEYTPQGLAGGRS
jgi:predicted dithiol-disulfide oxidoreductase (DUF899 family)